MKANRAVTRRAPYLALGLALALVLPGCRRREEHWLAVPAASPTASTLEMEGRYGGTDWLLGADDAPVKATRWLVGLGFWGTVFVLGLWSFARRDHFVRLSRAEQAFRPDAPLRVGPIVLLGTVETEDSLPAATLTIHQHGAEYQHKGQWTHTWKETSREFHAKPFTVRTDQGLRVRIVASGNLVLKDALDETQYQSRDSRTREAKLKPGERVYVPGILRGLQSTKASVYRASESLPWLEAPPGGKLVVSTEAPGDFTGKRAKYYTRWLWTLGLLALGNLAFVLPTWTVLSLTGTVENLQPVQTNHYRYFVKPKNSPGYWQQVYEVRVEPREGTEGSTMLQTELSPAGYHCVTTGQCPTLPFTVSTLWPASFSQLGSGVTVSIPKLVWLVVQSAGLWLAFVLLAFSSLPWYLRRRVHERGTGRL